MNAITMVLEGKTVEIQQLDEKLTPKQKAIDGNGNGKMDAEDFKMLRASSACPKCGKTGRDCRCNMKEDINLVEEAEELTEALRKISEHGKGTGTYHAVVKYDPEYQEYQSHFYKNGEHMGEGPVGYHGSGKEGKQDAQDTAEHEVKRMNSRAMSEGADMDQIPAYIRKQKQQTQQIAQKATDDRNDKAGVKVWNNPRLPIKSSKLDVFQNFGKKNVAEEVEELEELSHDTLQSYKRKTRKQLYDIAAAGPAPEGSKRKAKIDKRVAGYRKAWQKQDDKFYQTEEVSETTFKYNDFEIELEENLSYADYLNAVKTIVNSDDPSIQSEIISIAAEAYDTQDMNVMIEAKTIAHANSVVESLRKADINTTISNPESVVLEGKPGFKYSKTNNGKTSITIHTASGVVRKV